MDINIIYFLFVSYSIKNEKLKLTNNTSIYSKPKDCKSKITTPIIKGKDGHYKPTM